MTHNDSFGSLLTAANQLCKHIFLYRLEFGGGGGVRFHRIGYLLVLQRCTYPA